MIEIKTLNGKLNTDDSQYRIPANDYQYALNITKDAVEGSNDMVVSTIVANRIGDASFSLPAGRNVCIGAYANTLRGTVIQFIWNENDYHLILEFNIEQRVQTSILRNLTDTGSIDILGFTEFDKITGIDVFNRDEGDLLIFLDSLGRPSYLDIELFKAGAYTPVTRDLIDMAKCPPLAPPSAIYNNDTTRRSNELRDKIVRFKTRWHFDDFTTSTTSPIGEIPLPINILDDTYTSVITNNNVIDVTLNTGGRNVSKVELLMSYVQKTNDWSDFLSVNVFDKSILGLPDDTDFLYKFYSDSTYPAIDVNESIQLFDEVPELAKSQAMPNGNVVVYGAITEGLDNDIDPAVEITVNTVAAGGGSPTGGLNAVNADLGTLFPGANLYKITFSGLPAIGTSVTIKSERLSDSVVVDLATYTTVSGDTVTNVTSGIFVSMNAIGIAVVYHVNISSGEIEYYIFTADYGVPFVEVVAPGMSSSINSIPTFPFSTSRRIGLVYYDKKGKTNGVLYNARFTTPAYAENGSQLVLLPYINAKIYHVPPSWAYSYNWVLTKENTQYIYWYTTAVNTTETEYIYFNVSNFKINADKSPTTEAVLSYSFKDGDRMRLIKRDSDNVVFNDTYDAALEGLVVDPKISGVTITGTFLKIKKVAPFASVDYTSNFFIIQIYSPSQQSANSLQQTYYEFGQQYYIGDPTLSTRYHKGMVADQDFTSATPAEFNFYAGDAYFRIRNVAISESGAATFNVIDRNFVDFYISAVNNIDGRAAIIDPNAKRAYHPTLVRFGGAYQPNTNINGLNRFYNANFDEYDASFADVLALEIKNRQMVVCQKFKIGAVGIFNKISKNPDGTQLLVVTDKLLNPIDYYTGDFGIGTCPESIASFNYAIYGCDNIKGVIWRLSKDGLTPISIIYKVNSWATRALPLRTGDAKIYGAFDQKLHNYIAAIEPVASCVAVNVADFTLPKGYLDTAYTYSAPITGSYPYTLSGMSKPDWMTISLSGNTVIFSGTPDTEGENIPVLFTISNPCGEQEILVTINILEMQTGTIDFWGGSAVTVPAGWLLCDGSAVSRTTYADLFAVIGVIYGVGDGSTTFNIPPAGRLLVPYLSGDPDYGVVGNTGGNDEVTLTDQNIAHDHDYDKYVSNGGSVDGDNGPTDFGYEATATTPVGDPNTVRDPVDVRSRWIVVPLKIKT